jgi:hypothetical protein
VVAQDDVVLVGPNAAEEDVALGEAGVAERFAIAFAASVVPSVVVEELSSINSLYTSRTSCWLALSCCARTVADSESERAATAARCWARMAGMLTAPMPGT